jgi:hypothetical protein
MGRTRRKFHEQIVALYCVIGQTRLYKEVHELEVDLDVTM